MSAESHGGAAGDGAALRALRRRRRRRQAVGALGPRRVAAPSAGARKQEEEVLEVQRSEMQWQKEEVVQSEVLAAKCPGSDAPTGLSRCGRPLRL